ncbi:tudor domain-containing protein 5 [Microcaecilia unicolor]|uniref:Tudor domain-containing protein 5 n=1 Tax=Microcaecilia unicolor TaxID=1415580 RepID=A0A6P7YLH1_9AMPH|nr:tudor domain-containing protein 5 [Microcaecilia unicolor]
MSDQEKIIETLRKEIRSLLTASKEGLTPRQLEQDYHSMIGTHLPLRTLGYRSTMELVEDMPDVVRISTYSNGNIILNAIPDEATKKIADLVSRQKDNSKSRLTHRYQREFIGTHLSLTRRGRTIPVLPASVKSELKDLLSSSSVLLSDFERAFLKRFGRRFQYTRYGFYSMFEVLRAASDIIQVQQTRAGSLLTLKNCSSRANPSIDLIKINPPRPTEILASHVISPVEVPSSPEDIHKQITVTPPVQVPLSSENTQKKIGMTSCAQTPCTENAEKQMVTFPVQVPPSPEHVGKHASMSPVQVQSLPEDTWTYSAMTSPVRVPPLSEDAETHTAAVCCMQMPLSPEDVQNPATTSSEVDLYFDCRLKKLEEEMRLKLARKGAGSVVDPELKEKIRFVAAQYPEGLPVNRLPAEFKIVFEENIPLKQFGFATLMELLASLSDVIHLEFKESNQNWLVFDAKKWKADGRNKREEGICSCKDLLPAETLFSNFWDYPLQNLEEKEPKGNGRISYDVHVVTKEQQWQWKIKGPPLIVETAHVEIPPDAVQDKCLHSLPMLQQGTLVGVFVENIISPSQFYINLYGQDTSEMLQNMMIEMRRCYSNANISERYIIPHGWIRPGRLCCLKSSQDVWWYRVIVHQILSEEEVTVYYPDFGNMATVKVSWLRFLKSCYSKLPAQAIPSSLAWVRPVEARWTVDAIKLFRKLCVVRPLVGILYKYIDHVLYLFLCDTSTGEDIYLHRALKAKNYAIKQTDHFSFRAFRELNPSALYLKPAPDQPVEEEHISEVVLSPSNSSPKESNPKVQRTLNTELGKGKTEAQEVQDNNLELPYLEPVSVGLDVWDENWFPLDAKVSTSTAPDETVSSPNQSSVIKGSSDQISGTGRFSGKSSEMEVNRLQSRAKQQEVICHPVTKVDPEELWDTWVSSNKTGRAKMGEQMSDDLGRAAEDSGFLQSPSFMGDSTESAVLTKYLEECYISLLHSKQQSPPQTPAKQTEEPHLGQMPLKQPVEPESQQTVSETRSVSQESSRQLQLLATESGHNGNHSPRKDYLSTSKTVAFSTSHHGSVSHQHIDKEHTSSLQPAGSRIFPQISVPRSTVTASLGAAARLATAGGLLQWFSTTENWKYK